jgi:hypothetical protein
MSPEPRPQMMAVRKQTANALLSSPEFVSASDPQKQEMAEALLIQTALIEAFVESAEADPVFYV